MAKLYRKMGKEKREEERGMVPCAELSDNMSQRGQRKLVCRRDDMTTR